MSDETPRETNWYCVVDGNLRGPYSRSELMYMLKSGRLPLDIEVARGPSEEWQTARERFGEVGPPPGVHVSGNSPLDPKPGLVAWALQAWEMVYGQLWPLVTAVWLTGLSFLTVIGWPMMVLGLYRMLLRRFEGERVSTGMVFGGFRQFLPALGWGAMVFGGFAAVSLLLGAALSWLLLLTGATAYLEGAFGREAVRYLRTSIVWAVSAGVVGTLTFYALPLIADGRAGLWTAFVMSWRKVRGSFRSHLLLALLLWMLTCGVLPLTEVEVGIVVLLTVPLACAVNIAAYKWHFRPERAA